MGAGHSVTADVSPITCSHLQCSILTTRTTAQPSPLLPSCDTIAAAIAARSLQHVCCLAAPPAAGSIRHRHGPHTPPSAARLCDRPCTLASALQWRHPGALALEFVVSKPRRLQQSQNAMHVLGLDAAAGAVRIEVRLPVSRSRVRLKTALSPPWSRCPSIPSHPLHISYTTTSRVLLQKPAPTQNPSRLRSMRRPRRTPGRLKHKTPEQHLHDIGSFRSRAIPTLTIMSMPLGCLLRS